MTITNAVAAVVPAAGVGSRMQSEVPKQYFKLGDRTVLQWTLQALQQDPRIQHIFVATQATDPYFAELTLPSGIQLTRVDGGASRAASVAAGVQAAQAAGYTWVAVHDAARPCLSAAELTAVIDAAIADAVGAILALPVADTLKRSVDGRHIAQSVERTQLWQALTPQVFRSADLLAGLQQLGTDHPALTDEASVFELLGKQPQLVLGRRQNLKITQPGDEHIAALLLQDNLTR
ncbi:2-C-methyl-D-erythritol 4-phosphate cytidylyltransferase [Pseudidiomarina salilacus]|uniref:2-C-methyl-D-erythritol 4-phosphate cytidylyltransferase n=1 Tax=Pseudidiomarina salilacus TaxID=3384452 RepID=UPI00398549E9